MLQCCLASTPPAQVFPGETSSSSGRREIAPQVDVFPRGSCGPRIALGLAQVLEATEDSMVSGLQAGLNPVWGGGRGVQCREHNPWLCLSPAGTLYVASSMTHFGISCSLWFSTFYIYCFIRFYIWFMQIRNSFHSIIFHHSLLRPLLILIHSFFWLILQ